MTFIYRGPSEGGIPSQEGNPLRRDFLHRGSPSIEAEASTSIVVVSLWFRP